ncbi:MAG: SprT family zinc-dependent metalloprotease [Methylococcales bacterium]|nr:SprT family zinc-dependent metalloprotease [Methylococcales bacterium]
MFALSIKKSKRKTLSIYIERDGSVSVLAPDSKTDDEIAQVLKDKEYQIYKHLAEWHILNTAKVEREVVNGQSYLYLGRNYRLELVDEQSKPLLLKNGYFLLRKQDKTQANRLFIEFYKEKGLPKIMERVQRFKTKMDVEVGQVRIMELQNRWASCSDKGNLNFHWKCFMASLDILDYLVVHELAHLIHQNHTRAFWNEVDKVLPNYQKQVEWLKVNGAALDL